MRKIFILTGIVLVLMSCGRTSRTTVGVRISGMEPDTEIAVVTSDSTYITALDSVGSAVVVLAEDIKPGYASLRIGRMGVKLFIEPGKSLEMALNAEDHQAVPVFTGAGAKKTEYLNTNTLRFPDFKVDEEAFIKQLAEQEARLFAYLDSMAFDAAFTAKEKKRLHYSVYAFLPVYPSYYRYYAQDNLYQPSENYYSALKAVLAVEPELIDMPEYLRALQEGVNTCAAKDLTPFEPEGYLKRQLAYVQENIHEPALCEKLVHDIAMKDITEYGTAHWEIIRPVYEEKVASADKKVALDKLREKWERIAVGQPSPAFKCLNINGKEVSLSDLAGKYVYIDVWATWCGPCRYELPHLKTLEHQFRNKNIAFVSISCDQDKAAWEKMVKEDKLGGIQLIFGKDRSFMDAYRITGIPRFILLDREGKIVSANMTRPSNPETAKTLKALKGI